LSAPCQLLILAGPEHGRTIPLADLELPDRPFPDTGFCRYDDRYLDGTEQ